MYLLIQLYNLYEGEIDRISVYIRQFISKLSRQ